MSEEYYSGLILNKLKDESLGGTAKGIPIKYFIVDGVLPEGIAQEIYTAFPGSDQMRLMSSFREHKYISKNFDEFNSIIRYIALAFGRPVLASLNGEGARMVIEAEAGLTAPAGDARALADTVLELFRMTPEERDRLGANGHRYFQQHFDRTLLVDQLLGHFRSVASRNVST